MDVNNTMVSNKRNNYHYHDVTAMLMNTDDIDEMKFIKLVQKQEILYDRKCVHFTNEQHKQHIWKEIANKFKCSAADCMAKWMMLRQRFIREKEKEIEREMKSGKLYVCSDEIKSSWKYMEAMRFMEPHVTLRIPSSLAMHLPERFTTISKQSTQKLAGHNEDQEKKLKSKSQNRPDSRSSGCRKHQVYEKPNKQQPLQEPQRRSQRQQGPKIQNQVPEQRMSQQVEIQDNGIQDNKDTVESNAKTKNMITTFLMAKQNRMKNMSESQYKRCSSQSQYCQPLVSEDAYNKTPCHNNNQTVTPQPMPCSNSAPNTLYPPTSLATIRKKPQRHEIPVTPHTFTPDGCYSKPQQFDQKPTSSILVHSPQRGVCEQASTTQNLPLILEEDKRDFANLSSMVTQLIGIVKSVHKTQNELLDVKRSSTNSGNCGRHRFGSISHKLNESGASIATNFPSASFTGVSFTSEEIFGRLIASEISHLDSEVLVNNAKLLILKIIYKLRLGETVSLH